MTKDERCIRIRNKQEKTMIRAVKCPVGAIKAEEHEITAVWLPEFDSLDYNIIVVGSSVQRGGS